MAIDKGNNNAIINYNIYKSNRIKYKELIKILNNYNESKDITLFKPLKGKIIKYYKLNNDKECEICMDTIVNIQLLCHNTHIICLKCLLNLSNDVCPYCRQELY